MKRVTTYLACFALASALGRWLWWCGYADGYRAGSFQTLGTMMRGFRRYQP